MSRFFRRRTSTVATLTGLGLSLLVAATAFAADGATLVFDADYAFIMPAAIIMALVGEMVILVLKHSGEYD